MNLVSYLVLGGILASLIAAVWIIARKKRDKSGCGCCPYSGSCADAWTKATSCSEKQFF